jgi:hypothetical protein
MKQNKPTRASLKSAVTHYGSMVVRYKVLLFAVVVAGVYGYVIVQINSLNSETPSDEQIAAQADPIRSANIDPKTIEQLKSLRDNSVNVQSLFDFARDNPFQE